MPTLIAGGLITLEFASTGLNYRSVGAGGNADRDADIPNYVVSATPVIEDIYGPVLLATRTRAFDGGREFIKLNEVAQSVTSVLEVGNTITDWFFDTTTNTIYAGTQTSSRIFYPNRLAMTVTYVVGYATVPMNLQMAARELVRFWVQQGKQGWRPNGQIDADSVVYTPQGFAVPKRVMELCVGNARDKLGGFA